MKKDIQILILAGGTGTRLWPLSREKTPKQFQPLVGKLTLFQLAVRRARKVAKPENIFVATNEKFAATVRKQSPKIPRKNVIAEPAFRDTATCLGFAATVLEARNPGGVMAVVYADHLIRAEETLTRKLRAAAEVAERGKLAIIEVESEFPATQLGWVEIGEQLESAAGEKVFALKRFVEKPDLPRAKKFHASEKFLWNTGLYVWRTDVLLEKFKKNLPATARRLAKISKNLGDKKLIEKEYSACEKISIDFGVMEKLKSDEVAILPARLGWSDVGTWESLAEELAADHENLVSGVELLADDTRGCVIYGSGKKLVATIGLSELVIVDTPDALLICPKNRSCEVKKIVEKLAEKKKFL